MSLTIKGLVLFVLGWFATEQGVPIAEGALETTIETLLLLGGAVAIWWGRVRHGDINWLGFKKNG